MKDLVIEPMVARHLADVLTIEREQFAAPWSPAMFKQEVEETWLSRSFVGIMDGQVVGFIVSWFLRGEIHVLNLAVATAHQRRGIGRALLQHVLDEAERFEGDLITLEVRVSNEAAKMLYIRMGFAPVGIRRRYYRDNDEDALVMTKRLRSG